MSLAWDSFRLQELYTARKELEERGQTLAPDLVASIQFVLGRENYRQNHLDAAIDNYQQSLNFWRQNGDQQRQGMLLVHLGLCYKQRAVLNRAENQHHWETARQYFQQSLDVFEQANRPDIVASFIGQLGEILRCLGRWDELQILAQKSLPLHQTYPNPARLARDYGFLAEIELEQENWSEVNQLALQALQALDEAPDDQRQRLGLYLLLLAQSQRHLNQMSAGVASLERAKAESNPQDDPSLYIHILDVLRGFYFEQKGYIKAFAIKQEQRSVESQYGFRAFIGAGRLQPRPQPKSSSLLPTERQETIAQEVIAQEIAASDRKYDIDRLVQRVSRDNFRLTIIHGPSGVGKSSTVNAGLVPTLKHKIINTRDVLPISLAHSINWDNWEKSLGQYLVEALAAEGESLSTPPDSANAILEQLRRNEERNLLTVLIFDQFEEFFIGFDQPVARQPFFEFLSHCFKIPYVKVILVIREDYLHFLLEYERLPNANEIGQDILNRANRYELGNFTSDDTRSIIQGLTERSQFHLESALVDELVRDLAEDLGEVRPIELQIVGAQLQAENITTLAQYQERGPKAQLVQRYLAEIVEDCGPDNKRTAELVLYLLTGENDTRPSKTRAEIEKDLKVLASGLAAEADNLDLVLRIFVESGLVFLLPEVPANRYQLVHDYLVTFIRRRQEPKLDELIAKLESERRQHRQTEEERDIANINARSLLSQALLLLHDQLGALVAGVAAGRELQQIKAPSEIKTQTICRLRQALYSVRECNRLQGHEAGVTSLSFSPDGQTLASASEDGTVKFWRIDGSLIQTFLGHDSLVTNVCFSPDGQALVSTSGDGIVKIWRLDGSEKKRAAHKNRTPVKKSTFGRTTDWIDALLNCEPQTFQSHDDRVTSVSFSSDGQTLASAGADGTVKLWCVDDSQTPVLCEDHLVGDLVHDLSFSPDGQTLAYARDDGKVQLRRIANNQPSTIFQGHTQRVASVSFSPHGKTLISASWDGTVKLWHFNGTQLQELRTFEAHKDWITGVSFSPDGQILASASVDGAVKLWSLDGNELQTFRGHTDKVTSIRFSPDGQILASAGGEGIVKLWRLAGNQLQTFRGHADKVTSISFSPNSQTLASADEKGIVKLWRLDGTELETLRNHHHRVTSLSFSPDGQTLASASEDGEIGVWCLGSDERIPYMHTYGVTSVSFSPNGQTLAFAGEDGAIELWSKDIGQLLASCKHGERLTCISFSPDNQLLAVASLAGTITLRRFHSNNLQELQTFQGHSKRVAGISFSPDGQILATASEDCKAKLWSLNGTELRVFRGHKKRVTSVSFSPDGNILATGSEDCTIKLWSLDGIELQTFQGHSNSVMDISFSPNGKILASASQDRTVILWNLDLDDLLVRACNWLHDYLKTNPNVSKGDRILCDSIGTRK
ncbi:MAG: hypothetical protein MJA27_03290 [Pseudanabaenales cyanobacterium]|nr:hypothetical protein [Pseudanabaenales cyanobacterium]